MEDIEYEVEAILDKRYTIDGTEYLLKWKDSNVPTWQSKLNMGGCVELKQTYNKTKKVLVVVRDLQKQLPLPKFNPQPTDYYRKRKLYITNFGFYICNTQKMHSYVWNEYDGRKTADEIVSCMWKFAEEHILLQNVDKWIAWGDNCVAQNTCWKILFYCSWIVETGVVPKCILKALLVGHTFTMCDAFFGGIENGSYKKECFKQQDWIDIMRNSSVDAKEVHQQSFLNWDWLDEWYRKPTKDVDGEEFHDIRGYYKYVFFRQDDKVCKLQLK